MANDGTVKIGTEVDESGFKSGLSKLGSIAKTAMVGVTAATGAATAAIGGLTKAAVDGYAEYEQLAGGVETLFKTSSDKVMEYANNAYKTAGMSANEYMDTVTSFSASLLQGLGGDTAAAADLADQAIIDMSDNANKMGTDISMIQNAYQGFAKQNYTMLDNLKLGYGGTQAEMARLINDSGVLGDTIEVTASTVNDVSFDKIIEAIHVVQTNMGITGTTAAEAADTIEGSANAMKAAWSNLVTGLADDDADLDTLITNFVDSVATYAENIIPIIEQALSGIGELITKLAPIIAEKLPEMISSVLPSLLTAGAQLIEGLIGGIVSALPSLVEAAVPILLSLVEAILGQLPAIAEAAVQIITTLAEGLSEALPDLIPAIVGVVLQIVETLTQPDTLTNLIDAAVQIILALAEGLIKAVPQLIAAVPQIIANLVAAIIENGPVLGEAALELLIMLGEGLIAAIPELLAYIVEIPAAIIGGIKEGLAGLADIGPEIIQNLLDSILNMGSWLADQISGFFSGIIDNVKNLLGLGGGGSGGTPKSGGGSPRRAPPPPSAPSDDGGDPGPSPSPYSLSRAASTLKASIPDARTRMISDLATAIPAAQSRVAIATADMAPSAGYSAPPPASYGASGNDSGRQTPIIVRPNIHIHFDGDLAQFAQVFKPVIDAEDARVGQGVQ